MDARLWSLKCPGLEISGQGGAVEAFSQNVKIPQIILQLEKGIQNIFIQI
jgi:hypothetical protein